MKDEKPKPSRHEDVLASLRTAYKDLPPVDDVFSGLLAKFDEKMKDKESMEPLITGSTLDWTMSSETSTETDALQPWQLFTLAGLIGANRHRCRDALSR